MKSVKAKPLTPAVANRNRIAAVANVTTLASMIAEMPFLYPERIAARGDLPLRASSRTRSKMTTLASDATPMVRMIPAMPGRVSVMGTSTATA